MTIPDDNPQSEPRVDLSNVESINNLDTARMTLRWALERLQNLENAKKELVEKAEVEERLRRRLDDDLKSLRLALAQRDADATDRELYYARLEEYFSARLSGEMDVPALAKREAQVAKLQEFLQEREAHLGREHAAKIESLERHYRDFKINLETDARAQTARVEEEFNQRRKRLDEDFVEKKLELTDRELRLKAQEGALVERERRFGEFYQAQRAQLAKEIKAFQDSKEDELRFRLDSTERFLTNKHESLEAAWVKEKAVLLQEISQWRHKTEEQLPRLLELERKLVASQESGVESVRSAERKVRALEEEKRAWERDRETLLSELRLNRERSAQALGRILELEKSAIAAEEAAKRAKEDLARALAEPRRLEEKWTEREKEQQKRFETLRFENKKLQEDVFRQLADHDALEAGLLKRFTDIEDEIHRKDVVWKSREESFRKRDQSWHEKLNAWQEELARKAEELDRLKDSLVEAIRGYKSGIPKPKDSSPG